MKIGIVIPAHNEEQNLSACLQSIELAIQYIGHGQVKILVVLDSCTDQSLMIVKSHQMNWIECNFACVGKARDLGIRQLIDQGVTWVACTDADTIVDPDWLLCQREKRCICLNG